MSIRFKINELKKIFGSKTKAQEVLFLLNDVKEVVRQGFYEHELRPVEEFCLNNGLYLVKSKFKVLLDDKEKFSNKGLRIQKNDPRDGMFFVYISKDELKSTQAAYHEISGNDVELGLLLGYPSCCVKFFFENFSEENPNPEIESDNPFTNITKRSEDDVIISHFPCRADCEKSIEIGKRYLEVIRKYDKERAEELMDNLTF